jgi:hypothetical protein
MFVDQDLVKDIGGEVSFVIVLVVRLYSHELHQLYNSVMEDTHFLLG